jgi:hypothetical protein
MGAFLTNLQIRNASTKAICDALPKQTQSRAYVSAKNPRCRACLRLKN